MSISVTKNQQQNNFNPLKWTVAGAAAGYIAKDALPLTKAEKEHYQFDEFITDRKSAVRKAVAQELIPLREIVKNGTQDKGYDAYIKFVDPPKDAAGRAKYLNEVASKLPDDARATFERLRKQVGEKVHEVKRTHDFMYRAAIKKLRPTISYVLIGSLIATGAAFVSYVLSKMSNSSQN